MALVALPDLAAAFPEVLGGMVTGGLVQMNCYPLAEQPFLYALGAHLPVTLSGPAEPPLSSQPALRWPVNESEEIPPRETVEASNPERGYKSRSLGIGSVYYYSSLPTHHHVWTWT